MRGCSSIPIVFLPNRCPSIKVVPEPANVSFHDLRHTAATRLAEVGENAFLIASILGHSNIQMSARYAHGSDEAKRLALEKIAQIGALCSK